MLATVLIPSSMVSSRPSATALAPANGPRCTPAGSVLICRAKSGSLWMPTVGSTLMLDRLGPKRSDAEFLKSKLEAPGARFLVLADLKPVIRSNAQRTEAKLAWFSHRGADRVRLPRRRCLLSGHRQGVQRALRPGGDRASHPQRPRRHREASPHRRPALAGHAGHHDAGGAFPVRPGPRARPVARECALLRPLRRHHAGQGRRLAAQVLGLRPGVVSAHRSRS